MSKDDAADNGIDNGKAMTDDELRQQVEQLYDTWFYNYAQAEPDETHTLVLHEVHDDGAGDDLKEQLLQLIQARDEQVRAKVIQEMYGYWHAYPLEQFSKHLNKIAKQEKKAA